MSLDQIVFLHILTTEPCAPILTLPIGEDGILFQWKLEPVLEFDWTSAGDFSPLWRKALVIPLG